MLHHKHTETMPTVEVHKSRWLESVKEDSFSPFAVVVISLTGNGCPQAGGICQFFVVFFF